MSIGVQTEAMDSDFSFFGNMGSDPGDEDGNAQRRKRLRLRTSKKALIAETIERSLESIQISGVLVHDHVG
jgi:hypothetical protein